MERYEREHEQSISDYEEGGESNRNDGLMNYSRV